MSYYTLITFQRVTKKQKKPESKGRNYEKMIKRKKISKRRIRRIKKKEKVKWKRNKTMLMMMKKIIVVIKKATSQIQVLKMNSYHHLN